MQNDYSKINDFINIGYSILALIFRAWCESNPLDAWVKNYPFYAYILVGTTILDAIGIFASAIYLLFFIGRK